MSHFIIKELSEEEFQPIWDKYRDQMFGDDHSYSFWKLMTEEEKEQIKHLGKDLGEKINIRLVAYDKEGHIAGWSWGFQESRVTFYMANSAVLPKYQRQGLYSSLMNEMITRAKTLGFQLIYSRHCATNNAVLIPKLKAGFVISKMEICDIFGVLIHLHYYTNKTRRKIMDYRCGQTVPDKELKEIFGI